MEKDDDVLLLRPWDAVSISGTQFFAKTCFGDTSYHIILTNMHCVWEETMDSIAIEQRAQRLNKRLRAPVHAFFAHLCKVVRPALTAEAKGELEAQSMEPEITLAHLGEGLTLRLKSELAGLPFYWEFCCSPIPVTSVFSQMVRPLLVMSRLLQHQVGELSNLLARKDLEIQDYRENGATLSRERLQTELFDEQSFRENSVAQVLPQLSSNQQDNLGFDLDLQRLYAAVVSQRDLKACKRTLPERSHPEEELSVKRALPERCHPEEELSVKRALPGPPANSTRLSGEEQDSEPSPMKNHQSKDVLSPYKPREQQSPPIMAATSDHPAHSKPKKKKARGLFR